MLEVLVILVFKVIIFCYLKVTIKWAKDEMDSVIESYVNEKGTLSKDELNDLETGLPSYTTVRRHKAAYPNLVKN